MAHTKQVKAAAVLNNAFDSTVTGGDGKELCATDHPLTNGSTFANEPSTAADLNETSLEDALIKILTEPKNALSKQFNKLFEMENVELDIREEALMEIAKKAIQRKTGARGLRSIIENILMETMYKVPSEDSLNKVVIDASVVNGDSEPLLVYEKSSKSKTG